MKFSTLLISFVMLSSAFALKGLGIKVETLVKSDTMWDGTPLPDYPQEKPEITIIKVTIPAKTTLPMHKHPSINAGYMLKGKLTVVSKEGKEKRLQAGDPLIELTNKYHYGKNEGDEDVEIVVFYAGTKGAPLSIKHEKKK